MSLRSTAVVRAGQWSLLRVLFQLGEATVLEVDGQKIAHSQDSQREVEKPLPPSSSSSSIEGGSIPAPLESTVQFHDWALGRPSTSPALVPALVSAAAVEGAEVEPAMAGFEGEIDFFQLLNAQTTAVTSTTTTPPTTTKDPIATKEPAPTTTFRLHTILIVVGGGVSLVLLLVAAWFCYCRTNNGGHKGGNNMQLSMLHGDEESVYIPPSHF